MKKRIISLLMVIAMLLAFAVPAFAAKKEYALDEFDVLTDDELDELNEIAADISEEYGIDVFFAMIEDDLEDFDVEDAFFKSSDYIALVQNDDYVDLFTEGDGDALADFGEDLWDTYNEEDTYIDGAKAYYAYAESLIEQYIADNDQGTQEADEEEDDEILRLVDEAKLLSSKEAEALLKKLDETSKEMKFDIIIVTMDDFGGNDVEKFTEDLYDQVYGKNRDGVILLISMEEHDWCISGNGEGKDIFTSSNIDAIGSAIKSDLSDENYADAFDLFVEKCVYYIDGERNGYPFEFGGTLLLAAFVGLLVAVIATAIMKGQLKSVRKQRAAQNYVKPGSLQITFAREFFLYNTVTRSRRTDNSSSSGSGSHSTGSGKF